jgi:hypothetical protein
MVGNLIRLTNPQSTGYERGQIGIITRVERVGALFNVYWALMPNDHEAPFWDSEFEVIDGEGRSSNCDGEFS